MTFIRSIRIRALVSTLLATASAFAQSEPNPGPGLGNLTYSNAELFSEISRIAPTDGGALGVSTAYGYNLAHMVNGYMVTLFAEDGGGARGNTTGGIQFYDVSNPRSPRLVKRIWEPSGDTASMRELHAMCFGQVGAQKLMVLQSFRGIQIWDVADVNNPTQVSAFDFVNGGDYTDTPWQLMWQHPYVYAATGGNGLYIVDVSDPAAPKLATRTSGGPNPIPNGQLGGFNIGPVWTMGNRLVISAMNATSGFSVFDLSEPTEPKLLAVQGSVPESQYSGNFDGVNVVYASQSTNGRTPIYRIAEDGSITQQSYASSPAVSNQLYTSSQDNFVFLGCQREVVKLDISNPQSPTIVGRGGLSNVSNPDFGQANLFGNVIMVGNDHGTGSGFVPHQTAPDTTAPEVMRTSPAANEVGVSTCSRIGIAFSDSVQLETLTSENIAVTPLVNGVPGGVLSGVYTLQYGIVNFTPTDSFQPNTTYTVTLKENGVKDWAGNGIAADHVFSFRTGASCGSPTISEPGVEQHYWSMNGDVNDSVGALDGALMNGASIDTGALVLDGSNDYLALPNQLSALSGDASLSFFLRTDQAGSSTSWTAPGVTGVEVAGGANDIFWGWIDSTGRLRVSKGDGSGVGTSIAINDNVMRHYVLTRDAGTGAVQIFIDGVLHSSGSSNTGTVSTAFSSIGRIEDTATIDYLKGTLDEVRVFNHVLSSSDVTTVYNQSRANLLTHHWPLSVNLADTVGGLNGVASGGPSFSEGGMQFDGSDDGISLGGTHMGADWTVSVFVKRTGNDDEQVILGGDSGRLQLSRPGSGNKVGITNSLGFGWNWNYSAPLNTWVHLVFVKNTNNTTTLYVDGESQGSVSGWIDLPLVSLGAQGNGSNSSTVNSTDVSKVINESNANVTSTLTTDGLGGSITDVNVTLNITHVWDSDLDISLVHPDGTSLVLSSDNGSNGDNYTNTVFDQQAGTAVTSGSAPFSGSYRPEQSLDILNGKSPNGEWRLQVIDDFPSADHGSLNSWSVTLTTDASNLFSGHLNGVLDDVCVFSTALSASEVSELRGSLSVVANQPETGTLGGVSSFSGSSRSRLGEVTYSWDFGDGTTTVASTSPAATHTYAAPGHYTVRLTASDRVQSAVSTITHTVVRPVTAGKPVRSRTIDVSGNVAYCVNIDNDTLTAVNGAFPYNRLWEMPTGDHPRTLAVASNGNIWVANKEDATVTVHSPAGVIVATHTLPRASRPHGLIIAPDNSAAYVSLEATGQVVKLNLSTGGIEATGSTGPWPRGLAMTHDSARLFVTRFISDDAAATITELNPTDLSVVRTFSLAADTTTVDDSFQARGVANYLNSLTITPDGQSAWFPSKKDNIFGGMARDGERITFETSIRPITSTINIAANHTAANQFIDFNDVGLPVDVEFSQNGGHAFVAIEGSNQIEIRDTFTGNRRGGTNETGFAPRGLASSADGSALFVHHFMQRTVRVYDISQIRDGIGFAMADLGTIDTVNSEKLSASELNGKQIFYNSGDGRMAADGYISCASCHDDGGHDGRTWDFTQRGEGLRNTTTLNGRAGMGHGRVHWTGNFDELQDFEHDIRGEFGGSGFLTDVQFNTGTRNTPLGDPKAGLSQDLDDLAAYMESLDTVPESPHRNADGSMTASALRGREVFTAMNCYTCHDTDLFTDSNTHKLHNVGTIKASSGQRLGSALIGFDTPTLKGIWNTAPYLHDGSAGSLQNVIADTSLSGAHGKLIGLDSAKVADLVAYLQQLDDSETASSGYDRWKHENFDLNHILAGSVSLQTGDDDGDGQNNFFEYVFGTDPQVASTASVTKVTVNGDGTMELVFKVADTALNDANIVVEASDSLSSDSWESVSLTPLSSVVDNGMTTMKLLIPEPSTETQKKFYRLNVSAQ